MKNNPTAPLFLVQCTAYHPLEDTIQLIEAIIAAQSSKKLHLCFIAPLCFLAPLSKHFSEADLSVGAEMMLNVSETSFTATVSAKILQDANAQFVLVGSSAERYALGGENFKDKIRKALSANIQPIVCVRDSLQEHFDGLSKESLKKQLSELLGDLQQDELEKLYLCYDPIWINETPWEAKNIELHQAYSLFKEVTAELFPTVADRFKTIYAVPTYSPDLSQLMISLNASGYSLGLLKSDIKETVNENLFSTEFHISDHLSTTQKPIPITSEEKSEQASQSPEAISQPPLPSKEWEKPSVEAENETQEEIIESKDSVHKETENQPIESTSNQQEAQTPPHEEIESPLEDIESQEVETKEENNPIIEEQPPQTQTLPPSAPPPKPRGISHISDIVSDKE